jgi:hypothetical protein
MARAELADQTPILGTNGYRQVGSAPPVVSAAKPACEVKPMKCPRCGSTKLRKSNEADSRLTLVVRPFVVSIQCYWCGHQFYRPTALADDLRTTPTYPRYRRAA